MFAIQFEEKGNTGKPVWAETETPDLKDGEALVAVKAAGVNRADILQKKGLYPPPEGASDILGLELAGEIEDIRGNPGNWMPGDRVMALVPGGAYASMAVVPVEMLLPVPKELDINVAASIPEALYTAYVNLFAEGKLQKYQQVLIHSGAGGVGSTAIQLAKNQNANVVATCGDDQKLEFCRALGADQVVNYRKEDNLELRLQEIAGDGFDLVLDTVGSTAYASMHLNLLKPGGRWILIGLLGGKKVELDPGKFLFKNILFKGSTLRNKSLHTKIHITKHIRDYVLPGYEKGEIKPVVDKEFDIREMEKAHQYMIDNNVRGKIILEIP